MKVKCINNENVEGSLKIGIEYPVEKEINNLYVIKLGNGVKGNYLKSRFERVED